MNSEGVKPLAIVSTFYESVGGTSRFVENVRRESARLGYAPIVFSPDMISGRPPHHVKLNGSTQLFIIWNTFKSLFEYKPVIVQCHAAWYLIVGCVLYKFLRKLINAQSVSLLTYKHSDVFGDMNGFQRILCRIIDEGTDCIAFPSHYLRKSYLDLIGCTNPFKTKVIPPGCTPPSINREEMERVRHIPARERYYPILTYVGLFAYESKVKGLYLLLECIQDLVHTFPQILLLIAGKGSFEQAVRDRIECLGLRDRTLILTDISNSYSVLRFSHLHCHITFQDSFGLAVLEALSAGVPVVASSYGEIPRIEIPGLRVVDNRRDAIVISIKAALEKPPVVDVDLLHRKYSWETTAQRLAKPTDCYR